MISISTLIPANPGNIVLHNAFDSTLKDNSARSTLVATLDGGAVLVHSGIAVQDRNISIKSNITESQESIIWDLFNNNQTLLLVSKNEIFVISIKSLKTDNGKLVMSIYIISKEN